MDYRSTADLLASEKNKANDQATSELFKALALQNIQGYQARQQAQYKDQLGQQAIQRNLNLAKDTVKNGSLPEGSGLSIGENGNVAISKGFDPNRNVKSLGAEADRVRKNAAKLMDPVSRQLETIQLAHEFLDNPSSFDQKKGAVLQARLVEGQGQRLLDSVIQTMGGGAKTLQGSVQDRINYFTGSAQAGLTPEQRNKMRESLFKYEAGLRRDAQDAISRFKAYAPQLAPLTHLTGGLDSLVNSEISPITQGLGALDQRRQQYMNEAGQNTQLGMQQPQYQSPSQQQGLLSTAMSGVKSGLAKLIGTGSAGNTAQNSRSANSNAFSGFVPSAPTPGTIPGNSSQASPQSLLDEYNALKVQRQKAGIQ